MTQCKYYMNAKERKNWAEAIATRISDEWAGAVDFPETKSLLQKTLRGLFQEDEAAMQALIGTELIEEDYFDNL